MSEAIEKFRGLEKIEAGDELADLFPNVETSPPTEAEGSNSEINQSKEITEEVVAQMWAGLGDVEKKFVSCPQEQFDSIMPKYEQLHGLRKANDIRFLRILINKDDPRSPMSKDRNEAAG